MLEHFFTYGPIPAHTETGVYEPFLVLVSYLVASFGSYTGLTLAAAMANAPNRKIRNLMHVCGAFALGSGIWSMHFIGMLAFKMKMAVAYDPLLTAASMIIAIIVAGAVLTITRSERLSAWKLMGGAILLGIAICAMHYTGMAAMIMDADLRYKPGLFFLSVAIAVTASGAALWIVFSLGRRIKSKIRYAWRTLAALVMGAAICGMHYTGMAAAVFIPFAHCRHDPNQSFDTLAFAITAVTSVVFAIALVFALAFEGRSASAAKKDNPFPVKLLGFSLLLTLLAVLWASGSSFYIDHEMKHEIRRDIEISNMGDQIVYIDTIIANALQRFAVTGNPKWKTIYDNNTRALNNVVGKLKAATLDRNGPSDKEKVAIYQLAQRLDKNTDFFLQATEAKVLDLASAGKLGEAQALLNGQDYTARRQDYSSDVHQLGEDTSAVLSQTSASLGREISYTFYLGFIVITVLPIAWYFSFNSVRRWREELENARKALIANEKQLRGNERQLQRYIGEIEMSQTEAMRARKEAEKEARTVTLLRSVAATANKTSNIDEAIETVLKLMCDYMDSPVGHAYILDARNDVLQPTGLWHVQDKESYKDFVDVAEKTKFGRGIGLPGQVWDKRIPIWTTNLAEDPTFPRLYYRADLGVKSGLAFPLIVHDEVAYVLEFFFAQVTKVNDELLYAMQEIGNQLVHVVERAQAEDALRDAKNAAEKANASKSEFLANMSHELRTPLNSILGMLRLLKEGKLGDEKYGLAEEYGLADIAFRSSVNLLEIVNDILDLSKIEAGEMKLERVGMDLIYMLDSTVAALGHAAKEKRLFLVQHKENENFPYVLGDPTRLMRVLVNLIGNAIKYTDEGRVDIKSFCKKVDDTHVEFRCEIMDTGIGILKEKQRHIFEKFIQADTSTTRKYGGTGLGLAITKQLVELMGGTIGVESEVGVGSTFWFTIVFETTDQVTKEKQIRKKKMLSGSILPERVRILVAEDHPMNQMLITKLLKKFGVSSFEIAGNGAEALKRYQEAPWDVVLMDCFMPEKNGYETTKEIRALEKGTDKHVPIVAMTANAMVGEKEKCLRYGMDEYISKPIGMDELKEILGQWIRFDDLAKTEEADMPELAEGAPLDLSQLRSFSEGDVEMEKELTRVFTEQSDKNLKTLADALTSGDMKAWQDAGHMFKGGALGIGAVKLAEFCSAAQHFDGTPQDQAALFEKINREYARVKEHLQKIGLLS
ncbi:MAG: response regulator [Alphaproteobacteria bacterium]|nr:response regulator [Alphaproteobacteria bacterium]